MMNISVNVRQLGSKRSKVNGVPFFLEQEPRTVAELIAGAVRSCVAAYNERWTPESSHSTNENARGSAPLHPASLPAGQRGNQGKSRPPHREPGRLHTAPCSGVVHQKGGAMLSILPVHSQHRGKLFLPFADDDPKTAGILSKVLLLAEDDKLSAPMILRQLNR